MRVALMNRKSQVVLPSSHKSDLCEKPNDKLL